MVERLGVSRLQVAEEPRGAVAPQVGEEKAERKAEDYQTQHG